MILLLLALGLGQAPDAAPASQEARATLQSCEMTPAGWVCNYQMPAVILRGAPPGSVVMTDPPAITVPVPPTVPTLAPPIEISSAEADRQARLIARCADASWFSLCLPDDRREARALRDAANARAALRADVSRLLSEDRCDEAIRAALAGGDMALAVEVRNQNFCASRTTAVEAEAEAAIVPN
ncbi:hypothetical protein [Brevundimonas sp.]|uniref:hypothetical protein n=1 Tax=Brevundimonas sp. TaxID=1871086 RepID=UPI002737DA48|nr:hypothetical protein [Brevundimonas sp.]MDP3801710.1 hypothetical protein [Brevundimonas sp.]